MKGHTGTLKFRVAVASSRKLDKYKFMQAVVFLTVSIHGDVIQIYNFLPKYQ